MFLLIYQMLTNVQKAQVVASKYVPIQKVAMSARAMLDTCWNPMSTLVKVCTIHWVLLV